MNYQMSERDSDWNGPMPDPNKNMDAYQMGFRAGLERAKEIFESACLRQDGNPTALQLAAYIALKMNAEIAKHSL